jgi:hypothetical protein
MKGIWLRLDQGIENYGWFATTATDGNGNPVKTNVNGQSWIAFGSPFGGGNPDVAVRVILRTSPGINSS